MLINPYHATFPGKVLPKSAFNRLISNFEYGKIFRIDDLFAKAVCRSKMVNLGEKWLTLSMVICISRMLLPTVSEILKNFNS